MNIVIVFILISLTGMLCIISFSIGVFSAELRKINLNPIETYKEQKKEKKIQEDSIRQNELETRQLKTMMENIENYDGTSLGQKDIPNE